MEQQHHCPLFFVAWRKLPPQKKQRTLIQRALNGLHVAIWLSLLSASGGAFAKLPPLINPDVRFDDGQAMSARQMHDYILAGADRYTEKVFSKLEADANGEIRMVFTQARRHVFRVAIPYDETGFQINYVSSSPSLPYRESDGERLIHPSYLKWVNGLVKEIKMARQMRLNARGEPSDSKFAAYLEFSGASHVSFAISYAGNDNQYEAPLFSGYIPTKPMKVYGYSLIRDTNMRLTCGPMCLEFEPIGGHNYEVRWTEDRALGKHGACLIAVHDVSNNGDQNVSVSRESCPVAKSWFDRLFD